MQAIGPLFRAAGGGLRWWTWLLIGVLGAGAIAASLLSPLPGWLTGRASRLSFWRRPAVRDRVKGRRGLILAYGGAVVAALLVGVIWALPSLLTRHPRVDAKDRQTAITNTRTGLVAVVAVLGAGGGLAYTARTYRLTREGHITDRYTKSVEQLGSEKSEVRLGGIYALERLMRDSPGDQPTIVEVLAAYVREHSARQHGDGSTPPPVPTVRDRHLAVYGRSAQSGAPATTKVAEDILAALTVLGRRTMVDTERPIDLKFASLSGANLFHANLAGSVLAGADLTGANLIGANLAGATLRRAVLAGAFLPGADLTGADLDRADLTGARLGGADLTGANLAGADLEGADLTEASLTGADLTGTLLDPARTPPAADEPAGYA